MVSALSLTDGGTSSEEENLAAGVRETVKVHCPTSDLQLSKIDQCIHFEPSLKQSKGVLLQEQVPTSSQSPLLRRPHVIWAKEKTPIFIP